MEVEHLLVPFGYRFHFSIGLVTDTMINSFEFRNRKNFVKNFFNWMLYVTRKERSRIIDTLNESVSGISISLDS